MSTPLLDLRNLSLGIRQSGGAPPVPAVRGLEFTLRAGETLALVGESGCGKSLTALALMRLLPAALQLTGGTLHYQGKELFGLPESAMRAYRGLEMAMIFQEPATSLNPVLTVGEQIGEVLARRGLTGKAARQEAGDLLRQVGIADPARRLDEYPFQFSGGMKQRAMIAIALAGHPRLLIADEPTTALDVTVQSQILDLLAALQRERGMALLLITHDLGVVARMAHRVGVMYAGEIVESAACETFFRAPRHPYSQALFAALPEAARRGTRLRALAGQVPALNAMPAGCRFAERCEAAHPKCRAEAPGLRSPDPADSAHLADPDPADDARNKTPSCVRCHFPLPLFVVETRQPPETLLRQEEALAPDASSVPLLHVENLKVYFPIRKGLLQRVHAHVRAVDGVHLQLHPGRTLALVGESGCGKTTVGKALIRLIPATDGTLSWQGKPLFSGQRASAPDALKTLRRNMQMVFQDPFASLNPHMTVGDILLEGMRALKIVASAQEGEAACAALLHEVGLHPEALERYPHEFSGGQRQRIAIARALAVSPRLMLCDEPTSALDVSVQAQILNLLKDMQEKLGLAYLFITHNFAVVEYLAHEVAVMYLGRIVEQGPAEAILNTPTHPYTEALLSAVPRIEGGRPCIRLEGETPSPAHPPKGCHFHPRCPKALPECREHAPATTIQGPRQVACHLVSCGQQLS
jgi:peptide/nickel transport system ATP-binding protein